MKRLQMTLYSPFRYAKPRAGRETAQKAGEAAPNPSRPRRAT